jgi:hypothetical protein
LNAGLQQIADFHISDHIMEVQAMVSVRSFAIGTATLGAALIGIHTSAQACGHWGGGSSRVGYYGPATYGYYGGGDRGYNRSGYGYGYGGYSGYRSSFGPVIRVNTGRNFGNRSLRTSTRTVRR